MILQALCGYYRRAATVPGAEIAQPGYAVCPVKGEIVLDREGNVAYVTPRFRVEGKKQLPLPLIVPAPPKRSGQKPEPAFLYETVAFLFGIYDTPEGAKYRFDASRRIHEAILSGCEDEGAEALLKFFQKRTLGNVAYPGVDTALLQDSRMFVVFKLQGDECFLHEREAIRQAWERHVDKANANAPVGQCLVTGKRLPVARIHGNIAGFGQDKPTLVGFNQDAFCSFGKYELQGLNAPVSRQAAFEYVTALNMLCTDPKHYVNLGGDKLLFWAERDAPLEEELMGISLKGDTAAEPAAAEPTVTDSTVEETLDEPQNSRVRGLLHSIYKGGNPKDYQIDSQVRFYLLIVAANKTRLVLRGFHENSFGTILDHLMRHYRDISVEGMRYQFPSPFAILVETAVQRKRENIPPTLQTALMRSILDAAPYPQTLYQMILIRIRADKNISWLRAGVLRAAINRQLRREAIKMGLDKNEMDKAYCLGRFFALMERAQYLALGEVNATLTDKYLNSALATPQMVFPVLMSLSSKHVSKIQRDKPGAAVNIGKERGEILDKLALECDAEGSFAFPPSLGSNEQGKFLLGYYHQTQEYFKTFEKSKEQNTPEKSEN